MTVVVTTDKLAADIAKTHAETAKLKAETAAEIRKAQAGALKDAADLRKVIAEAQAEEARGTVLALDANKAKRLESRELAKDEHHHVYVFDKSVGEASVTACIHKLAEWSRNEPGCDIEIIFNSPGGSVIDGMALYDYICQVKRKGHTVTTNTLGMAASMAGILLQAGDVRQMGAESWLLIHEASFGAGGSMGEVEDTVEWIKAIQERILSIFAARSNLTKAQIRNRWRRKNWWLSSDESLKLGLIDEIV